MAWPWAAAQFALVGFNFWPWKCVLQCFGHILGASFGSFEVIPHHSSAFMSEDWTACETLSFWNMDSVPKLSFHYHSLTGSSGSCHIRDLSDLHQLVPKLDLTCKWHYSSVTGETTGHALGLKWGQVMDLAGHNAFSLGPSLNNRPEIDLFASQNNNLFFIQKHLWDAFDVSWNQWIFHSLLPKVQRKAMKKAFRAVLVSPLVGNNPLVSVTREVAQRFMSQRSTVSRTY
jgi:hypothetical protein